jgi:DNA topoisomerase-1
MAETAEIKISKRQLKGLLQDSQKTAEVINLVYVSDKNAGIERVKEGKSFVYLKNGKKIRDKNELARIRQLVLPPAWENVWICRLPNGHLQATGVDVKGRKQYRYHNRWNDFRNQTKFYQLLEFGKKLPCIREVLEKDLAKQGMPLEKILAAVVTIMQHTNIRVGNTMYEKLYGSFGLTTLKDKHVTIKGSDVKFSFKGKKGVFHEIHLKSRKLANIVKKCRDIPGQELFQYYDANGERKPIDSGMINEYIKDISGCAFTTKDFRTWTGTVLAIEALKEIGCCETETEAKKKIAEALDGVAKKLGNTRAVCKKYYVHPVILDMYTSRQLDKYFSAEIEKEEGLSDCECLLLKILGGS